jgi:fibronectin type 3 domain-containing protein
MEPAGSSQLDGTFKPIASGVTAPTYVDHAVRSGAAYRYFVKAVDAAGNESPPSNPASAVIP